MAARAVSRLTNNFSLYVGNIPWTVGNQELKEYFSKFAKVTRANIIFDKETGLHKGFGFVVVNDREAVQNILQADTHKIDGRPIDVKLKEMQN